MADGRDGALLLRWSDGLISPGLVAATQSGDALVFVSSLYALTWADGHLTTVGQPGSPRINVVRLHSEPDLQQP